MAVFLEGVESITLACTLVILLPTIALALAARGRPALVTGSAVVGTATMMWARAGRLWELESDGAATVLLGVVIAGAFVGAARGWTRAPLGAVGLGLIGGAVAGWLWEPCVGSEFAEVLNRAEGDRAWSLAMMHSYVAGALLPAALLVAIVPAVPATAAALQHRRVQWTGAGLGLLYALAVALGWYGDLVGELFRISSRQ